MTLTNNNQTISTIPTTNLQTCHKIYNLTFCTSAVETFLSTPSHCVTTLINQTPHKNCTYKEITTQNYITSISAHSIYCFVTKPILFCIICDNNKETYTITHNKRLNFDKQCNILPINSKPDNNSSWFSIFNVSQQLINFNFSIYDSIFNEWTNVSILNKHEITLINISTDLQRLHETATISLNSDFDLVKIFYYIFSFIIFIVFLIIFIKCTQKRSHSPQ